jgi:hypothetical protein
LLRQVVLEVSSENRLQAAAAANGCKMTVEDCKPFNAKGMSLLLELKGPPHGVRETISAIRRQPGVKQVVEGETRGDTSAMLVVLDRPPVCHASTDSAIICLNCPISSPDLPAQWRFIARSSGDLRRVISGLEKGGSKTRILEVSPLDQKAALTGRQKEIISIAVAKGYFEFPRRISLTELSQFLGIKPSTLSEILRSAERRILENAIGVPA